MTDMFVVLEGEIDILRIFLQRRANPTSMPRHRKITSPENSIFLNSQVALVEARTLDPSTYCGISRTQSQALILAEGD